MRIHFISDLHLSDDQPATMRAFLAYLAGPARTASALYILGDLFEYWAGDDHHTELGQTIADALRALSEHGTAIRFMAGNRDFLVGQQFAAHACMTLLPDPTRLVVDGVRILLTHGDQLCTDDTAYLAYRETVRASGWQRDFLARPVAERVSFIESLRARSRAENASKSRDIMDVNAGTVDEWFRNHDCTVIIHGHTHRPKRHEHEVDGKTCIRWVLPDWDDQAHYMEWRDGEVTPRTFHAD